MKRVNQSDLAAEVAAQLQVPTKQIKVIVREVLNAARDHVIAGNSVYLSKFMRVVVKASKARKGRNPRTGASVRIPAGFKLSVKTSVPLKRLINDGRARRGALTRLKDRAEQVARAA